jgi:hypothetical protein
LENDEICPDTFLAFNRSSMDPAGAGDFITVGFFKELLELEAVTQSLYVSLGIERG